MSHSGGNMLSQYGTKYVLPVGTIRQSEKVPTMTPPVTWTALNFPPLGIRRGRHTTRQGCAPTSDGALGPDSGTGSIGSWLLLSEYPAQCLNHPSHQVRMHAQAYKSLNRIQSIVYPTAYKTNENMLVAGQSFISAPSNPLLNLSSPHWCCKFSQAHT